MLQIYRAEFIFYKIAGRCFCHDKEDESFALVTKRTFVELNFSNELFILL